MKELYISNVCAWAPGLYDDVENWKAWKEGKMEISAIKESPKLEYTDPLFRRRLSQITKMTVHVIHTLLEKTGADNNSTGTGISKETKINFISLRGEIEREFTINKSLIEDGTILPAGFSLSVFNTPVASATLAFGLKGGYTVIFPSKGNFDSALKNAVAPVLAGTEKQIILVYADEFVPDYYGDKRPEQNIPFAFAAIVSTEPLSNNTSNNNSAEAPACDSSRVLSLDSIYISPVDFLKLIL
ncbi:MAG: beta-ketoacyl synthase chain length factor [Treponema sp.]|nr:beta-ketoacyl synthase chain length factor [Treponema sp.]